MTRHNKGTGNDRGNPLVVIQSNLPGRNSMGAKAAPIQQHEFVVIHVVGGRDEIHSSV